MSARWHQLDGDKQSDRDAGDEDDGGEDDEEEEEEEEGEEESDASGDKEADGVADADGRRSTAEHRIDITDRGDSFWDDDDEDEENNNPLLAPPSSSLQLNDDHSIIDVLAAELRQRAIPSYLDQFEVVIPDAELLIGAVPLEDIQQREREIEEATIRRKQLDVELFRQRETRLLHRESQIRDQLKQDAERRHQQLVQQKLQFAQTMQLRTRRLTSVFQQAESHLKGVLRRQQARVQEVFGSLEHSQVPAERRKYKVEWNQIPVTIKIRTKMLRALKDKLPGGQYVLLATLYDRLGGHALHWTAWDPEEEELHGGDTRRMRRRGRRRKRPPSDAERSPLVMEEREDDTEKEIRRVDRPNVTKPFHHRGRFYNTDVAINQNLFVVCPPQSQLRPGNVLVVELFLLDSGGGGLRSRHRSSSSQSHGHGHHHTQLHDQIVAWGALPLMTPEFTYVEGKFKIPLLRGEMDATMDKYRDIEDMYTQDLSAWLCNLYLHVSPMKDEMERLIFNRRGGGGGREEKKEEEEEEGTGYDIEIDQRNAVYRLRGGGVTEDEQHNEHLRIRKKSHVSPRHSEGHELVKASGGGGSGGGGGGGEASGSASGSATILIDEGGGGGDAGAKKPGRHTGGGGGSGGLLGFWTKSPLSKTTKKNNRIYAGSVVTPQLEEEAEETQHSDSKPIYKPTLKQVSHITPPSPRGGALLLPLPSRHVPTLDEDEERGEDGDTSALDLENYRFSVNASFARESAQHVRFHMARKLAYLRHELFVDLGVSRQSLFKMEFWLLLLLLAFALWLRVYVHYVAQWLFLKANRVPVFYFQPQWTTCMVKYTWRTVATHTEIGVLVMGVLGNWLFFASLATTAAISQAYIGELPAFGSKFLVCVGLATLLDPYLVLLVDVVNHQYHCASRSDCVASLTSPACKCVDGDAFKLYTRFLFQEGSGLVGILVTVVVYAALTCLSLVALYMYLLHIHMNGRMLDVYRRIHAQETDLFLPHDCEISLQELRAICEQAGRWKGPRGTQRKVFVHDYVLQDPLDPSFQEKSTHIALYTISLEEKTTASTRELYRHFLKSHDGAIIELFGQVGTHHDGSWQQDASPGVVSSLAILYNIVQDHHVPAKLEATAADLATLFADEPAH